MYLRGTNLLYVASGLLHICFNLIFMLKKNTKMSYEKLYLLVWKCDLLKVVFNLFNNIYVHTFKPKDSRNKQTNKGHNKRTLQHTEYCKIVGTKT